MSVRADVERWVTEIAALTTHEVNELGSKWVAEQVRWGATWKAHEIAWANGMGGVANLRDSVPRQHIQKLFLAIVEVVGRAVATGRETNEVYAQRSEPGCV